MQLPPRHMSPAVSGSESEQGEHSSRGVSAHFPLTHETCRHGCTGVRHFSVPQVISPWQKPPTQLSPFVRIFPSSHPAPSGLVALLHNPVSAIHSSHSWHSFRGAQRTPAQRLGMPRQTPCVHSSPTVAGLSSSHRVPLSTSTTPPHPNTPQRAFWHIPCPLHSTVMFDEFDTQSNTPLHRPSTHTSRVVSAKRSSHSVPSGSAGSEHSPVEVLHAPGVRHADSRWHTTPTQGLNRPTQLPLMHLSSIVSGLLSLHSVSSARACSVHVLVAMSHTPTAHLPSHAAQTSPPHGVVPLQTPLMHSSPMVSTLPSSQAVPSFCTPPTHSPVALSHDD
eukprot:Hpha_TRINITY_DN16303_c2_g5::TRINITY_DN16303_c2_g5_i2::g.61831::m.61831